MSAQNSKSITCCELLDLFFCYYRKKFGVDGVILFSEEMETEDFFMVWEVTVSLFKYFEKKEKLCDKCKQDWRKLRGEELYS